MLYLFTVDGILIAVLFLVPLFFVDLGIVSFMVLPLSDVIGFIVKDAAELATLIFFSRYMCF